ncbi:MAG: TSUP family transporter [Bacteroidota bacterium]
MLYALLGAVAIGLVLGLLGSGGSILTVPVLVYLAGEPDKVAIAESLAIVGAIAAVGAIPYARQRSVDWRSVGWFGVPGILGTYLGAALSAYVSGPVQLALFAVVMLLAAGLMLRGRKEIQGERPRQAAWIIMVEGLAVGVLTGLVGVGGGFLIVPALVLLGGLSMRVAVGTSLLIIAAKSLVGFWKYVDVLAVDGLVVDWRLIGVFAAIGIVGATIGNRISQHVPQAMLRRGFAVFLLVMGVGILAREAPAALAGSPEVVADAPAAAQPTVPADTVRVTMSEQAYAARYDSTAQVIDVRTGMEVGRGRVAGAHHVNSMLPNFAGRVEELNLDPERPVYLYCGSGVRSDRAARALRDAGYEAYNIGGFRALRAAGVPTAE